MYNNGFTKIEIETMHAVCNAAKSFAKIAESLSRIEKELCINDKENRERIYREVQRERLIEEAMIRAEFYAEECSFSADDYEKIADEFADCYNCDMAESDIWRDVIERYARTMSKTTE